MHNASDFIRRICPRLVLACTLMGSAQPAAASVRGASRRNRHAAIVSRSAKMRAKARRLHSQPKTRSSYIHASARIPSIRPAIPATTFPPQAFSPQDGQRIPRQTTRKTAALQGIIRDSSTRGIAGVLIALTNRATGLTRKAVSHHKPSSSGTAP